MLEVNKTIIIIIVVTACLQLVFCVWFCGLYSIDNFRSQGFHGDSNLFQLLHASSWGERQNSIRNCSTLRKTLRSSPTYDCDSSLFLNPRLNTYIFSSLCLSSFL